jgi:YVTN family beta-propeller protein
VFTANTFSNSVSILDLTTTPITVTNVPLAPTGGLGPRAIAFDEVGQRVFTANLNSDSVSIIDLANVNTVINIPLAPSGGDAPFAIAFDETGQRVFTANLNSDSVSIIDLPTVAKICQDSGFDTGDIRIFESNNEQTIQQISCVNFVGECSGEIDNGETRECNVEDYVVSLEEIPTNGESEIGILSSNMNNPLEQQQLLSTNDITNSENKIKAESLPTGPFIYNIHNY